MQKNITLEQSLQAYRVMNTPARLSWKQHWAQEAFSNKDLLLCDKMERKQFSKRLLECNVTICDNIRAKQGTASTLYDVMQLVINPSNKNVNKNDRKVVYSTNDGTRPIGEEGFLSWNGFQVIDMDIKNEEIEGIPEEEQLMEMLDRLLSRYSDAPHYAVCKAEKENGVWELVVQKGN